MSLVGRLVVREAARVARAAHRQRVTSLECDLAQCCTAADLADLRATLDRYPDQETAEIRDILTQQHLVRPPSPWRLTG
jgi:hypothetical protein